MQQVCLGVELDLTLYDTDEWAEAEKAAAASGKAVYTWSASGRSNWLSRGFHLVDRLGYVLLPQGLPGYLDMADDQPASFGCGSITPAR